jgi:hypothetical protein
MGAVMGRRPRGYMQEGEAGGRRRKEEGGGTSFEI